MSADNWTLCPICLEKAATDFKELQKRVETDYGKIPATEYLALVEKAENEPDVANSLREDWNIETTPDGDLELDYRCSFSVCGWQRKVKANLDLLTTKEEIKLSA